LDVADLEERSGADDAVAVRPVSGAVDAGPIGRREEEDRARRVAEFGAEVAALGAEDVDDGGRGAEADIELFEGVVVDEVELDVLVAAALARGRIGLAEEVELGPARCVGRRLGFGLRRGRGLLSRGAAQCERQQEDRVNESDAGSPRGLVNLESSTRTRWPI
jgi:hypothetical protein